MNEPPASVDAILASIRARLTNPEPETPAPIAAAPEPAVVPLAAVTIPSETATMTLDTLIRQLLEPQLKAWLDANMPEIVERLAREEIRRLTGKL